MAKYTPTTITYQNSGLVKDKAAFVLSDDAYQVLENIYQWRGRLRRRQGYDLLGRLRRDRAAISQAAADGTINYNIADILSSFRANEASASLVKGTVVITVDLGGGNETEFTDNSLGIFTRSAGTAYNIDTDRTITGISAAASAVITLSGAHSYTTSSKVYISGVAGMTEINDRIASVTAVGASTITVNINSSAFTAYSSGGTTQGSFVNYETGEVNFTWLAAATPPNLDTVDADYSYYPGLPVMGLPTRELNSINAEQTIAFDTIYSYSYNNTSMRFQELSATTPTTWTGTDTNFFWGINYWQTADDEQYYWVTNFSGATGDPIRIYDSLDWHTFAPTTSGTTEMHGALMLIPYKGRLVALNTLEGTSLAASTQFYNRARWSQNGAPFTSVNAGTLPVAAEEWRSDVKGRGGFNDAPTNEHIVSAEFVRDTLIVGFENSTWALRYTGNELLPFVWDRLNRELGTESTFSAVPFDEGILSVGSKSIHSCNGSSVQRIDDKIPDEVFLIHNSFDPSSSVSDGPTRVHGKRDFYERLVYWTFPDASTQAKFPDRVLVFNYHNQSWAIFTDSFTTFGEFFRFNDITWADLSDKTWEEANFSWVTAKLQSQFPNIVAGNQQGYVLNLNQKVSNSKSLFITAVTGGTGAVSLTVPNHNFTSSVTNPDLPTEYIEINGILGTGADELNERIFQVDVSDANTILLYEKPRFVISAITKATQAVVTAPGHNLSVGQHWYIDDVAGMTEINGLNGLVVAVAGNAITLDVDSTLFSTYTSGGALQNLDASVVPAVVQQRTYLGCGEITRVMSFAARSKKFNILKEGRKSFLGHIDFLTNTTDSGEFSCDIYTDYQDDTPINGGEDTFFNRNVSTQVEDFSQSGKNKEWHRFFCPTDAQFFEYNLLLDERQMHTPSIANAEFMCDAIILWSEPGGRLLD